MERIMRHLKCIIYLGAMYVEAIRESLYIIFGGKMLVGRKKKEKNHVPK